MGFNRRKMADQRRQAAEKEAATRRATDAQVLAAERVVNMQTPTRSMMSQTRPSEFCFGMSG